MTSATYLSRRNELQTYFDRTAVEAWRRLTSDEPLSGIRATVRAGRNGDARTRCSPGCRSDLRGARLLDAGCGSGALAVELAGRGAEVLGGRRFADAHRSRPRARAAGAGGRHRLASRRHARPATRSVRLCRRDGQSHPLRERRHRAGDRDAVAVARRRRSCSRSRRARRRLTLMHAVGRFFPRGDRAPAIAPISARRLGRSLKSPQLGSTRGASRAAIAWRAASTSRRRWRR